MVISSFNIRLVFVILWELSRGISVFFLVSFIELVVKFDS
jgi:hypothetical protein